jgi:hypothetical protein
VAGDEKLFGGGKTRHRSMLACCYDLRRKKRGERWRPEHTVAGWHLTGVDEASEERLGGVG